MLPTLHRLLSAIDPLFSADELESLAQELIRPSFESVCSRYNLSECRDELALMLEDPGTTPDTIAKRFHMDADDADTVVKYFAVCDALIEH